MIQIPRTWFSFVGCKSSTSGRFSISEYHAYRVSSIKLQEKRKIQNLKNIVIQIVSDNIVILIYVLTTKSIHSENTWTLINHRELFNDTVITVGSYY